MRRYREDPRYEAVKDVAFAYEEGDRVVKSGGDYRFAGMVTCCFRKRSGAPRYVVENDDGVVHVFNHDQLLKVDG